MVTEQARAGHLLGMATESKPATDDASVAVGLSSARSALGMLSTLLVATTASACGGKILETRTIDETRQAAAPAPNTDEEAPGSTRPPRPGKAPEAAPRDEREPCEIICARNVSCIGPYDCMTLCRQDGLHARCGQLARQWNQCFADHVAEANCTFGPPACRDTYCAYLGCLAPERTADYCK